MSKCRKCLGESISASCVELDDTSYDSLGDLLPSLIAFIEASKKPHQLDIKSLSTKSLTRDQIIQVLINEVILLKKKLNETQSVVNNLTGLCPDLNWDIINQCGTGDETFCEKLQNLINVVYQLKN